MLHVDTNPWAEVPIHVHDMCTAKDMLPWCSTLESAAPGNNVCCIALAQLLHYILAGPGGGEQVSSHSGHDTSATGALTRHLTRPYSLVHAAPHSNADSSSAARLMADEVPVTE